MVGGQWKVTAQSGTSMYDTWHWGPGMHSMRMTTQGEAADGSPWLALQVVYWHPGRKQACLLSIHPDIPGIGRGVGDGVIRFDGDTLEANFSLYQNRGLRKLRSHSVFKGLDNFRTTLLESSGPDGYQPLAAWDYFRVNETTATMPGIPESALSLPEELRVLESFVGQTWESKGKGENGEDFHVQSTFEYIPLAEYVYAHSVDLTDSNVQSHKLDMYFYHHVGTDALRCLALSRDGGVYEGDISALQGGGLRLDVMGYESGRADPYVVRFDFEQDGTVRLRAWSFGSSDSTLILDLRHKKLQM